jgi:putative ABC transport system permease protein
MVAYTVSQRRREFGVRTALGARPADLVSDSMRSALVPTIIGIAIGLSMAAYVTRFVESQLYGIAPLDVPTFGVAALIMLVAAGAAAYLPARAAGKADPMQSLRYE